MMSEFPPRDPAPCGLACAACGLAGDFSTTHTYKLRNGRVRRLRVCNHCGQVLYTLEMPSAEAAGRHSCPPRPKS